MLLLDARAKTDSRDDQTAVAQLLLRRGTDADRRQLSRLSQLETRPLPAGPFLVAEREQRIDAALSLATGELIADPFRPTAELGELLRLHAKLAG